ncbi:MAG: hypothetical protein A3F16_03750 [Deltaproteobacteria bacterium RIFCSPHIGHO2_12_FULL_43_9]|nr:MAG: hypothetical protein A3F16_03750 [Deltaproteobacteria bacterium RIFCSPHIGHO2_12_FULL_43_9]
MWKVEWGRYVHKQLEKLPDFIRDKFMAWVLAVEEVGLHEVKKRTGYHDECLRGNRKGQRSVRLNRAYRIIYEIIENKNLKIIEVIEVNKHEY